MKPINKLRVFFENRKWTPKNRKWTQKRGNRPQKEEINPLKRKPINKLRIKNFFLKTGNGPKNE